MSACCPSCGAAAPNPIQGPNNTFKGGPGVRPPAALVRISDYTPTLTPWRECDLHTAMSRGLAEYLGQQTVEIAGRRLQLKTYTTWAEPEEQAVYPAAAITAERGEYERGFTPYVVETFDRKDAGLRPTLMSFGEFKQTLNVEVWATDPKERAYLTAMVEEALNPLDWMYGFRLVLPFYHGVTATYELTGSRFEDSQDDSMKRWRRVTFNLTGNISALRMLAFPDSAPRLALDVS
jgi:hypothetical protein